MITFRAFVSAAWPKVSLAPMDLSRSPRAHVPVMKNTTLAEALYRVDVGQEIPEELYDAVAEVLNFVWALQQQNQK